MHTIIHWPLREVLVAFCAVLRSEALAQYRVEVLTWAAKTAFGGKTKAPKLPDILK
jgi:hypothetical protein